MNVQLYTLQAVRHEQQPTRVERLARFVTNTRFEQLSEQAVEQLKLRVLDSLGCALGALDGEPVRMVREHLKELDGAPLGSRRCWRSMTRRPGVGHVSTTRQAEKGA